MVFRSLSAQKCLSMVMWTSRVLRITHNSYARDSTMLMLLCFASSLMDISRAFSSLDTTCSMDGRCFLWPVHDRASFKLRSNASVEYSPFNLGSANSDTLPSWISVEAWEQKWHWHSSIHDVDCSSSWEELEEHHAEAVHIPCSIHPVVVAVFWINIAKCSSDFRAYVRHT